MGDGGGGDFMALIDTARCASLESQWNFVYSKGASYEVAFAPSNTNNTTATNNNNNNNDVLINNNEDAEKQSSAGSGGLVPPTVKPDPSAEDLRLLKAMEEANR